MEEAEIVEIIEEYSNKQFEFEQFLASVLIFFEKYPDLNQKHFPIIHSLKSRMKDPAHLKDKLERKNVDGKVITKETLFSEITDLIGVRILHLHQEQFKEINEAIQKKVSDGDWIFKEEPKALTWDPESKVFYEKLGITTELRETLYTSIHYVIQPNNPKAFVTCEIQVRTLFEEIWGEIDHAINYPHKTESVACKEQLRVLAKLASTGTRLADSIFRSHQEYLSHQQYVK
ncbi:MAG: RelA/SpoT domain-containing protein [Campylobacterales bacterium]|nr:RelA/SpoT domain-containing protein [Campylobacterales bacterium]